MCFVQIVQSDQIVTSFELPPESSKETVLAVSQDLKERGILYDNMEVKFTEEEM